ncbi:MAG: T9SS type A sorting domain-containing protein [Chitinophagaceae bacterium]|nr:MAG: T9SS type A sorting domain-containing protein [Chitinophagaceae bacterium]
MAYVDWYIDNNFLTSELSLSMYENDPPCGTHTLKAIVYLECGSSVTIETTFEVYCSWFRTLVVYPNPGKTTISIAPDAEKSKKNPMQGEYEATLYDRMGTQVSTKRSDKQVISMDIQQLPNDTYFLHLRKNGEKEILERQIIVQH